MNNDSTDLLLSVTGERSVRAIAIQAGFDPSTLTRQVKSGIKAESVIDIARAYRLPVVSSLVRFGFLEESEAVEAAAEIALDSATDEQLAQEILDRVRRKQASPSLTEPVVDRSDVSENVVRLEDHRNQPAVDERAVASEFDGDHDEDDGYDA